MYAVQGVFIQCIVYLRSVHLVHSTYSYSTQSSCMRQVRDGTKIYKYFCATISCDVSGHTVVQCPIFSCRRVTRSSCTLQKQSFLALDVALNAAHEGPHGRVVTLEQ